jgi:hypothetical protein
VFRWLLLARAPGSHTVPPFAVEVFDPSTNAYGTVTSSALSLTVSGDPASAAATAAQPGAPAPSTAAPTEPPVNGAPTFGPIRHESALLRTREPLYRAGWFPWLVLAAPMVLLGGTGSHWLRRRRAARRSAAATEGAGMRNAEAALAEAQRTSDGRAALAALTRALKSALEARLEEPIGGLTMGALRRELEGRGMAEPMVKQVVELLEQIELARFTPAPPAGPELRSFVDQTARWLREIARFTPRSAR